MALTENYSLATLVQQKDNAYREILSLQPGQTMEAEDAAKRFVSTVKGIFNALPAESARRKRCVPRFAPINVLIAQSAHN